MDRTALTCCAGRCWVEGPRRPAYTSFPFFYVQLFHVRLFPFPFPFPFHSFFPFPICSLLIAFSLFLFPFSRYISLPLPCFPCPYPLPPPFSPFPFAGLKTEEKLRKNNEKLVVLSFYFAFLLFFLRCFLD